jgi:hypothetical protein
MKLADHHFSDGLPIGGLGADLGLQVTGLAARTAIVGAVLTKTNFIEALAQHAVLVAAARPFRLVTDSADEFLGHGGRVSRFNGPGNGTMVDVLAGASFRMIESLVRLTLQNTDVNLEGSPHLPGGLSHV